MLLAENNVRAMLEREYLFIDVLSTFIRAIKIGAIHIKHVAIFLAHYGRLGNAVDAFSKDVVDQLKQEGMVKGNAEAVIEIVTRSLQEVRLHSCPLCL